MPNANRPSGAKPIGEVRARPYEAGGTIFPGDFVTKNASGVVVAASASQALIGVALEYAVVGEQVLVADDISQEFSVQADAGTTLAQAAVGLNYNIVATAGNATYRQSRMELDSDSGATNSTLPLRLLGFRLQGQEAAGEFAECVVKINRHQLGSNTEGL